MLWTSVYATFYAAAATTPGATDTAILIDASGKWPQCSSGPVEYMRNCVFRSDYFSYMQSDHPVVISNGTTCEQLGFGLVGPDGVFTEFQLYWKGGAAAFGKFITPFIGKHPDLLTFLNATRDSNPACKLPS